MDEVQIYRSFYHNRRTKRAWWNCKKLDDNMWRVSFHGDFVPSWDSDVFEDSLFGFISTTHDQWITDIKAI